MLGYCNQESDRETYKLGFIDRTYNIDNRGISANY